MRRLLLSGRFKKDYKRMERRGANTALLWGVVELLLAEKPLPEKYQDHPLKGKYKGSQDCHLEPDWVLIYKIDGDQVILQRTGTHSDLFSH